MKTTDCSLQQLRSDASLAGDLALLAAIDEAWDFCEGLDHICEWGDMPASEVAGILAGSGRAGLADPILACL